MSIHGISARPASEAETFTRLHREDDQHQRGEDQRGVAERTDRAGGDLLVGVELFDVFKGFVDDPGVGALREFDGGGQAFLEFGVDGLKVARDLQRLEPLGAGAEQPAPDEEQNDGEAGGAQSELHPALRRREDQVDQHESEQHADRDGDDAEDARVNCTSRTRSLSSSMASRTGWERSDIG